jgi:hypothetical protein
VLEKKEEKDMPKPKKPAMFGRVTKVRPFFDIREVGVKGITEFVDGGHKVVAGKGVGRLTAAQLKRYKIK